MKKIREIVIDSVEGLKNLASRRIASSKKPVSDWQSDFGAEPEGSRASDKMRDLDPGMAWTTGDLYQKIYDLSRRILDRDHNATMEGIDLIIDTFAEWEQDQNADAADEFLHRINLRKVHHELVDVIKSQVEESQLPLKKKRGFIKCANLVLGKIDDFRENMGAGTIGVGEIDLPAPVGCKANEVLVESHRQKGRWLLKKKDGGRFTKEEIAEVKNRLFVGEIHDC